MAPGGGRRSSTAGINANSNANVNFSEIQHPDAVVEYQVAASNSTLNAWVGGRKQPAWLTNAKPAKPTPRPPPPPRQPIQPITPHETTRKIAQPVPSAVEITTQPDTVPISASTPPTAFNTAYTAGATTNTAPPHRIRTVSSSRHGLSAPSQTQTQTTTTVPNSTSISAAPAPHTVLPSPAPSDEPSPGVSESQFVSAPPTTKAHFVLDTISDNIRGQQPNVRVSAVRARTSLRRDEDNSPAPASRTSTPTNTALHTPPTPSIHTVPTVPSAPLANAQMAPKTLAPREQADLPPAKRPCIQQPSTIHLLDFIGASRKLQDRLRSIGGEEGLDIQIERPRYQLLTEACKERDLFFVATHQLFCAWAIDRSSVHRLCDPNLHNAALIDNAFLVMGTLLKSNSRLQLEHVQWFATFPDLLPHMQVNPIYQQTIMQVLNFLVRLSEKWAVMHREHQQKGYPILVSELVYDLFLYSPILQSIVFRAIRRSLGVVDGRIAMQLEAIFKKDQAKHIAADGTLRDRPLQSAYSEYNKALITTYKSYFMQRQPQNQPPQAIPQGQPSNQYGTMNYPQHQGLTFPPHVNQHINPQRYPQSPATTPSSVHSPGYFQSPVPAHLTLSSNQNMPMGTNIQSQPNHLQAGGVSHSSHSPHPLYQQVQMQFIPQAPSPSPAPSLTMPNSTIPHNNSFHSAQLVGQWQQGPQSFPSQHLLAQGQVRSPVGQMAGSSTAFARHNSINAQHPTAQPANQAQGLNRPRPSARPQPRQKNGPSSQERLIPAAGMRIGIQDYPHSPYDRHSLEVSLHQAHLRSPKRIPIELDLKKSERYYQAIKSLTLSPTIIRPQKYVQEFNFAISEIDHARITREEMRPGESLPVSLFSNGSLRYRVRCCYGDAKATPLTESAWVTADAIWPEHIFVELNHHPLGIMRNQHHSKCTPAEASQYVVAGNNVLRVIVPETTPIPSGKKLSIAVEQVEFLSHSAVLNMVKSQGTLPSNVTRDIIKNRLSSNYADDDELAMLDNLSIDVTDPFSRTIFNIPVRGKSCTHLECFDLETWLNTRLGKKSPCQCGHPSGCANCPSEPSFVDKWTCPVAGCNGDARPFSLRVDGFLVEVRSKLECESKLGTKSILVDKDGNWKPKEEPNDDDSDNESDGDGSGPIGNKPSRASTTTLPREKAPIEVIELDDD
ncbi:hypothetical protein F4806DRAFT_500282 [Annulohypoxylon nitens]|nr:hypothetical protein F4806DRAFT_500282 [Annulohypoxylon nitens]